MEADHETLIIPTRTTTEPPTGARVELSMDDETPAIRLYDEQGHDVTNEPKEA